MKHIKIAESNRAMDTVSKILIGLSIFLAVFGYQWQVVIAFLVTGLALLLIYQVIILNIKQGNQARDQSQTTNDVLTGEASESKYGNGEETYLIFNPKDAKIFDTQNILSITVKDENNFIAILDKPLHIPYEIETIGLNDDEIEVRPTRIKIKFQTAFQGLTVVKITPK